MAKNKHIRYQNYSYCLVEYFTKNKESLCVITKDNNEAQLLVNELKYFLSDNEIVHFNENDILPYDHFSVPEKITKERFKIINNNNDKKHILISSIANLYERYPNKEYFKSLDSFKINTSISLEELIKIVESLNYEKKTNVDGINQFSVRGGIVDIYSPIYSNPLRVEIFDDNIDSIRFFDVDSQLSIEKISEFSISNGNNILLNSANKERFISNWRNYFHDYDERFCPMFQKIKNNIYCEGIEIYFPFFFKETINFFDLFKKYKYLKFDDLSIEINRYKNFINERYQDEKIDNSRPLIRPNHLFTESNDIKRFNNSIQILKTGDITKQFDSFNELEESINNKGFKNSKVIVITSIPEDVELLKNKYSDEAQLIKNLNEAKNDLSVMYGDVVRPIHDLKNNLYIFHKENLDKVSHNFEIVKNQIAKDKSLNEVFKKEDYVIHEQYGLGIYKGLEVINANETTNEYMKITYANDENLYIPLKDINKISNYHKSNLVSEFQIDSLSSSKWASKKNKAKKRATDHAAEILEIESKRNNANSSSLKVDKETLDSFENDFPYIETPDQINAIQDIKKDLSLIKPMNRVLCGDVGFGKTEVAMRASFISVFSNKQVIIVTPSTILCDQHFNSFIKRFFNHPVTIKKLNRFVSNKEKQIIIEDFNNRKIDILITTHIVFNNNIEFKNTGLLIIDEEHKFGIKHKNFIKDKQSNIHILYLSATPIPRTMNLVYSGLKDFSFLQTAPSNRISIKSFLKLNTSQILKEALSREKSRGGQCFIVQNDITKLESIRNEIQKILPDYKVEFIHGKLPKNQIKQVMNDFKNGDIDGLICTTIIEMGLDIPNANTIIIINSHKFGLSQLHQLRGRVGRSDKQGYCYFLIPTMELPKISRNRLDAVVKHSKLGEGFLIAQEDLEIRGGGEMLGDKQSGHIDNIGITLYLSMLKTAIKNNKENVSIEQEEIEVNFNDSAFIDNKYLPSPTERLKIYSQINKSKTIKELKVVSNNLEDRCGKMTIEILNLMENKIINLRIQGTGIKSIKSNKNRTNFLLSKNIKKDIVDKIINLASSKPDTFSITKDNKFVYKYDEINSQNRRINVNLLLDEIL